MIDVENPRVRMLLVFIGLMAATFIIISAYNLVAQSQQLEEMNQRICNDLEEHPDDIGIRVMGDSVYSLCECNKTDNGTWDCTYNPHNIQSIRKNLTRVMK
jgi:hypothetical protein